MSGSRLAGRFGVGFHIPLTMARRGILNPGRPIRLLKQLYSLARWGISPVGAFRANAARVPHHTAVIDPWGSLTHRELFDRSTRLAHAIPKLHEKPRLGLLCRNHRGFLQTVIAASHLGCDIVLLNTGASPTQLKSVIEEQEINVLIADAEFLEGITMPSHTRIVTTGNDGPDLTLEDVIAPERATTIPPAKKQGRTIVLTSGTTGTPKGARRPHPKLRSLTAMLSRIPLRVGDNVHIAAPLFHTWGYAAMQLTMAVRGTFVFTGKFDPNTSLQALAKHQCQAAFAVPVMLQRMLELPDRERQQHHLRALRAIAVSGSRLPPELAIRFMDEFSDVLYNLYGSTEVSWAAIAGPKQLRQAPDCAGTPPFGTVLRLLDDADRPVKKGDSGRIFVGNEMLFEGYVSHKSPNRHSNMLHTGDYGHINSYGSLVVEGRTDDMIVSGGENVMPREVEECIGRMPEVADNIAIGVDDVDFGQRLAVFVVVKDEWELDAATLKHRVKSRLAAHSVPRDIYFVESIPRNATGKVPVQSLREQIAARE
ncbi:AMP-binding protein [Haloglycomyces albus]|uniref:AMP-binding protein n=1 Tax=Haloglycomyces albus TaxID=526067 RepID=UPI0004A2E521|nr:AMP-binding protein [Haloglycomyces albus]